MAIGRHLGCGCLPAPDASELGPGHAHPPGRALPDYGGERAGAAQEPRRVLQQPNVADEPVQQGLRLLCLRHIAYLHRTGCGAVRGQVQPGGKGVDGGAGDPYRPGGVRWDSPGGPGAFGSVRFGLCLAHLRDRPEAIQPPCRAPGRGAAGVCCAAAAAVALLHGGHVRHFLRAVDFLLCRARGPRGPGAQPPQGGRLGQSRRARDLRLCGARRQSGRQPGLPHQPGAAGRDRSPGRGDSCVGRLASHARGEKSGARSQNSEF